MPLAPFGSGLPDALALDGDSLPDAAGVLTDRLDPDVGVAEAEAMKASERRGILILLASGKLSLDRLDLPARIVAVADGFDAMTTELNGNRSGSRMAAIGPVISVSRSSGGSQNVTPSPSAS